MDVLYLVLPGGGDRYALGLSEPSVRLFLLFLVLYQQIDLF